MTLKVLKGFIADDLGSQVRQFRLGTATNAQASTKDQADYVKVNQPKPQTAPNTSALVNQAAQLVKGETLSSSEAVRTTIRARGVGSSEKISDERQAQKLADDVADKIRDGKEGSDQHTALDGRVASSHLV